MLGTLGRPTTLAALRDEVQVLLWKSSIKHLKWKEVDRRQDRSSCRNISKGTDKLLHAQDHEGASLASLSQLFEALTSTPTSHFPTVQTTLSPNFRRVCFSWRLLHHPLQPQDVSVFQSASACWVLGWFGWFGCLRPVELVPHQCSTLGY